MKDLLLVSCAVISAVVAVIAAYDGHMERARAEEKRQISEAPRKLTFEARYENDSKQRDEKGLYQSRVMLVFHNPTPFPIKGIQVVFEPVLPDSELIHTDGISFDQKSQGTDSISKKVFFIDLIPANSSPAYLLTELLKEYPNNDGKIAYHPNILQVLTDLGNVTELKKQSIRDTERLPEDPNKKVSWVGRRSVFGGSNVKELFDFHRKYPKD